jgi:phospholipid/cholesterol/gamma-HCH transport system substrate-binding protein
MPHTGSAGTVARVLSAGALAVAAVVVAVLLLGSGGGYELRVRLDNAGQLVEGNLVKVGGRSVGKIDTIELTRRNQAQLTLRIDDAELAPLHEGTTAIVRATSLSGVANRYLALAPGPNSSPEIPDGGLIPAERTRGAVDLDAVLNTLDIQTRAALGRVVRGSATQYSGAEAQANAGLARLNPALSQVAQTTRELSRDSGALTRFVVESAAVASAVAGRSPDLEQGIANAAAVADAVARESVSLDGALRLAPGVLRRANTTLVDVRAGLQDLRPALREAGPVAPRLARLLALAEPVALRARPAVGDLRRLVGDLVPALRGLPALERAAVPAVVSAARALEGAAPVVAAVRPYVPDLVSGMFNGFGGVTGGYYDANGHYARISFQGGPYSFDQAGSLVPVPPADGSLAGYRKGVFARCPGGAAAPAPDRSNPYTPPEAPCKRGDSP